MSVGGPYNEGCAEEVNGCLGSLIALALIAALAALALHWIGAI